MPTRCESLAAYAKAELYVEKDANGRKHVPASYLEDMIDDILAAAEAERATCCAASRSKGDE